MKRIVYLTLGFMGLTLGTIGVFLPILPTVPFYLLAAFGFAKSSARLYNWFLGTRLYKHNLESYMAGEGMTWKAKLRIMGMVTVMMVIGFFIMVMRAVYVPCIILAVVWVAHVCYFMLRVPTIKMVRS